MSTKKTRKVQIPTCTLAQAIFSASFITKQGIAVLTRWVAIGNSVRTGVFKASVLVEATNLNKGDVSNAKCVAIAMAKNSTFCKGVKAGKFSSLQTAVVEARLILNAGKPKKRASYSPEAKALFATKPFLAMSIVEQKSVKKSLLRK